MSSPAKGELVACEFASHAVTDPAAAFGCSRVGIPQCLCHAQNKHKKESPVAEASVFWVLLW
jgi:hypothetical protein